MLTEAEKLAGRMFREASCAALEALWERDPADLTVPVVVRHYRHLCAAQDGKSVSLEVAEVYQVSPDGLFAFVYKDGRCKRCRITARSRDWLFFLAAERPPLRRAS
jgi:hypothetical protein